MLFIHEYGIPILPHIPRFEHSTFWAAPVITSLTIALEVPPLKPNDALFTVINGTFPKACVNVIDIVTPIAEHADVPLE